MSSSARRTVSIAIVDDNSRDRDRLVELLAEYEREHPMQYRVRQYSDGAELLENYQPDHDIILIDIQMEGVDGMRTAAAIRKVDVSVIIIFVTKTAQYATSGYAVQAQNYLLKPVSYFAFQAELTRSLKQLKRQKRASILVGSRIAPRRVDIADIIYIESNKHKITVHTIDDPIVFNGTLKEYEDILIERNFYRSNSGYLINLHHLVAIDGDDCHMSSGEYLKVSRSRKKGLLEALTNYIGGKHL